MHALSGPDEELAHGRRVGGGDGLELARRNDLAFAASDFVDLRKARPEQEHTKPQRQRR